MSERANITVSMSFSIDRKILNAFLDTCDAENVDKNRAAEEAFGAWTQKSTKKKAS